MENEPERNDPHRTTLSIGGQVWPITLEDGRQMRDALKEYLRVPEHTAQIPFLSPEHDAWLTDKDDPWIDQEGTLHIGTWVLQPRGPAAALVHRPPSPATAFGYQYVATLARTPRWAISGLTYEKLFFRR
jgi:hypothetical protein